MPESPLPPVNVGDELEPTDAFLVNGYGIYAATSSADPDAPAVPIVLFDAAVYSQAEHALLGHTPPQRTIRLLMEENGARAIVEAMSRALEQLDNVRRNQEGPDA